jgi:solute carrier family 30 (zinc transporter), member 1
VSDDEESPVQADEMSVRTVTQTHKQILTDFNFQPISAHREHRHKVASSKKGFFHNRDLGMAAALIHVIGDALNNIGVIISATLIWKTHFAGRFYADPAAGMVIAIMILCTSIPLVRKAGQILLLSPPSGVDVQDIKHDLENIDGVLSVHELHVWRLNQRKAIATGHVVIADSSLERFQQTAKTINECLHAYGVHSATMQPELATVRSSRENLNGGLRLRTPQNCSLNCGSSCELLTCCG